MRGKGKTFAAQPGIYSALRDRGVSQAAARQAEYEKAGERMKTKTKKQREIRNNATAWALMAPALIFMLAFYSVPYIQEPVSKPFKVQAWYGRRRVHRP